MMVFYSDGCGALSYISLVNADLLRLGLRSRAWEGHREDTIFHGGLDLVLLHALRELERARKAAEAALAYGIAVLLTISLHLALARDGEPTVMDVDVHVFLAKTRQLEASRHPIGLGVLVQVHPVRRVVSTRAFFFFKKCECY
jgi:hypothetical protein